MKQPAQVSFDDIFKDYEIPILVNNPPERMATLNYNTDMIIYSPTLQQDDTQYDDQRNIPRT